MASYQSFLDFSQFAVYIPGPLKNQINNRKFTKLLNLNAMNSAVYFWNVLEKIRRINKYLEISGFIRIVQQVSGHSFSFFQYLGGVCKLQKRSGNFDQFRRGFFCETVPQGHNGRPCAPPDWRSAQAFSTTTQCDADDRPSRRIWWVGLAHSDVRPTHTHTHPSVRSVPTVRCERFPFLFFFLLQTLTTSFSLSITARGNKPTVLLFLHVL